MLRSKAEADDPGAGEGRKVAEQGKQAKAEADKLVNKANKQLIYERIDTCLSEYDSLVRSFESTMAWFKAGRKAVRQMLQEQAAEAEQENAAKAEKKKADKLGVDLSKVVENGGITPFWTWQGP